MWNEAVQSRPALLARCAGTDDVALAIGHAHDNGLPLTVRAGGHNFAGRSLADGGVVIDVRDLTGIAVDPGRRVARLGAGLRWGRVDPVLQEHGLATTGGSVSKVGVAGFSLGTGLGWLGRLHGLAGDNLTGATVVTADGAVRDVGPHADPDLYWALRGAGTGLGVVTEFRMRLFPVVRPVTGVLIHRLEDAHNVLWQAVEATADAPSHLNWAAVLTCAPPVPALPDDVQGRPVFLVPVFSTSPDGDGAAERAWTEKGLAGLLHLSAGGPDINHLGLDEDPARARAAYSPATRARLAGIKKTYDPGNAFTSPPWLAPL
ncbi:FAD-binding oxidoreductase [Actinomadura sp. NPDC048394]|uniref:FAD-binding oxidoreductase n=1 Tax=Actinomadura sp. NPDC048394 TaxID=3158223 RepID=UPI0033EE7D8E